MARSIAVKPVPTTARKPRASACTSAVMKSTEEPRWAKARWPSVDTPVRTMKPPKTRKPQHSAPGPRTDWGNVADWYDQLVGESGSEYHREVVLPGVLRLLAVQPGDKAIDIPCGQDVLCRILHQPG